MNIGKRNLKLVDGTRSLVSQIAVARKKQYVVRIKGNTADV